MNDHPPSGEDRSGWHHLIAVPTQYEAHLLEGFLESQGVRVELESKYFSQDPLSTGALGNIHLWVLSEDAERAEKLVEHGLPRGDEEESGDEVAMVNEASSPE